MKDSAAGRGLGTWIGAGTALVTVILTGFNAYLSYRVGRAENRVEEARVIVEEQRVSIEEEQARLERFSFVHGLFGDLLDQDSVARTLTVNLITLAHDPEESQRLFSGFQTSGSEEVREVARIGLISIRTGELTFHLSQLNAPTRQARLDAVETLINGYAGDPMAVDGAVGMIEGPQIGALSASGQINVLVFLTRTQDAAWNPELARRARNAIGEIRRRAEEGQTEIGDQTEAAIQGMLSHLSQVERSF